jgi:hypothetical protein
MNKAPKAQGAIEETGKEPVGGQELQTAGLHAKDHLPDESRTSGTGSRPDENDASISPGGAWFDQEPSL